MSECEHKQIRRQNKCRQYINRKYRISYATYVKSSTMPSRTKYFWNINEPTIKCVSFKPCLQSALRIETVARDSFLSKFQTSRCNIGKPSYPSKRALFQRYYKLISQPNWSKTSMYKITCNILFTLSHRDKIITKSQAKYWIDWKRAWTSNRSLMPSERLRVDSVKNWISKHQKSPFNRQMHHLKIEETDSFP